MDAITKAFAQITTPPKTKVQLQAHNSLTFSQTLASVQSKKDAPVDLQSKIAEGKPDFSQMTKHEIVANINARYDSEIEKHYGTLVGVELKQARIKEWAEAGISMAERQEIEREMYIAANGFEGFSDDEIKAAILDKYGHAENLTEREFRQMGVELTTAGVGSSAMMFISTFSRSKETKAMMEMKLDGTYYEGARAAWRQNNPPSDKKMDWVDYYKERLEYSKSYGADPMSIASLEQLIRDITIS